MLYVDVLMRQFFSRPVELLHDQLSKVLLIRIRKDSQHFAEFG